MRIIEIKEGGDLNIYLGSKDGKPIVLKEGEKYVLNDVNAYSIKETHKFTKNIAIGDFRRFYKQYNGQDLDNKTLVTYRTGGAGDILFMTPGLRFLKEKYPTCKIVVCTSIAYEDLLTTNPYVDEFKAIPTNLKVFEEADYHILFERIIEENIMAEYENAYDLYLYRMGLLSKFREFYKEEDFKRKMLPVVVLEEDKVEYVKDLFEEYEVNDGDIKIGIHPWSTTLLRNYSMDNTLNLVGILASLGIKVFLLGGKGDADGADFVRGSVKEDLRKNIINLANHSDDFGYTSAMVSLMDAVVGIDSSILHIAGALGVPVVGLFGPFKSIFRIGYYVRSVGIEAKLRCAPCYIHGPYPCRYSNESGTSPCMEIIKPEIIIDALDLIFESQGKKKIKSIAEEKINEKNNK